jgi:hypothetical protein
VTHNVLLEATLAFSWDRWHPAWGDAGGGSRTQLASAAPMWEIVASNSRSLFSPPSTPDELHVNDWFKPGSSVFI